MGHASARVASYACLIHFNTFLTLTCISAFGLAIQTMWVIVLRVYNTGPNLTAMHSTHEPVGLTVSYTLPCENSCIHSLCRQAIATVYVRVNCHYCVVLWLLWCSAWCVQFCLQLQIKLSGSDSGCCVRVVDSGREEIFWNFKYASVEKCVACAGGECTIGGAVSGL